MNEAEKENSAKFNTELCAGTDLVMDEMRNIISQTKKGLYASSEKDDGAYARLRANVVFGE